MTPDAKRPPAWQPEGISEISGEAIETDSTTASVGVQLVICPLACATTRCPWVCPPAEAVTQ